VCLCVRACACVCVCACVRVCAYTIVCGLSCRYASLVEEIPHLTTGLLASPSNVTLPLFGDQIKEKCQQPGTTFCRPQGAPGSRSTSLRFTSPSVTDVPQWHFLMVNKCVIGAATVQVFGFSLQLYGAGAPFAIQRRFCPGADALHSDASCCVLNLCNAVLGVPGSCITDCGGTSINLKWNVNYLKDVAAEA
jgi:hypothetical protein